MTGCPWQQLVLVDFGESSRTRSHQPIRRFVKPSGRLEPDLPLLRLSIVLEQSIKEWLLWVQSEAPDVIEPPRTPPDVTVNEVSINTDDHRKRRMGISDVQPVRRFNPALRQLRSFGCVVNDQHFPLDAAERFSPYEILNATRSPDGGLCPCDGNQPQACQVPPSPITGPRFTARHRFL